MSGHQYAFVDRVIRRYGGQLRHSVNRIVAKYSLIGDPPIFDPEEFAWKDLLERNWRQMAEEARGVLGSNLPAINDLSPDHRGINADYGWKTFFLWGYGFRIDEACARCPRTAAIVEQVPGLLTAMFSVHVPGARLTRHRGVTKGMVTAHLPLIVPRQRDRVGIEVVDRTHHWREGELFVFDDTYEHETWNDTDEVRVLLLLHVKRPLRAPGRWLQDLFWWALKRTAFVRDAKANVEAWAKSVAAIEDEEAMPAQHRAA